MNIFAICLVGLETTFVIFVAISFKYLYNEICDKEIELNDLYEENSYLEEKLKEVRKMRKEEFAKWSREKEDK